MLCGEPCNPCQGLPVSRPGVEPATPLEEYRAPTARPLDITVNKFVTSFEFLQEDDEIGNESYLSNETSYNFSDQYSLKYRTRRNKKTDFTEFYNLIYEYKNDCLTASIQYNKDYYSDDELKPTEEIFFSISIIPLATLNTPSVR